VRVTLLSALRFGLVACVLATSACAADVVPCPEAPRGRPPLVAPPAVTDVEGATRDIGRVLDDWHDAAAKADEARYFSLLADDAIFMGTDATERWTKAAFLAYAHPHFEKGHAWTFRAVRRDVRVDAPSGLAWFDEDLDTVGLGPSRGSGVMRLVAGAWKIEHYDLAITVPNDRFDAAKAAATTSTLLRPEPGNLAGLEWLSGSWVGKAEDGTVLEEHWTTPVGGGMFGVGRATRSGLVTSFEYARIEARRDGSVVYVASPQGGKTTEFARVSSAPTEIVFENTKHDFPKRIVYALAGESARVRLEGKGPTQEWTMTRAIVLPK
jgi:hypothetical protein